MAGPALEVHLVDGTYELFRHHFAVPSHLDPDGMEVSAARGVMGTVLAMLEQGATHVGVATDHVIESFRNDLYPGYKTSEGMPPELLAQFTLLEDGLRALGVTVWPMVDQEADDGLAAAARVARDDDRVARAFICTVDKDLGQCVEDPKVVQLDRRKGGHLIDEAGVRERFGVGPGSIPSYLALVGDSADGFPGLPGWGAKSTATVLATYEHVDAIPDDAREWKVEVRGAAKLAATLAGSRDAAALFLDLATLRVDAVVGRVDDWEWRGALPELAPLAERLGADTLVARCLRLAEKRFP
jgi:5'-3' exonuclease